ncbi:MAG TPA: ceramidase domain-containing protein [Pseudomonadales bacterium]
MNKEKIGMLVLGAVCVVATAVLALQAPIAQDPAYHRFHDVRTLCAVPNFWNVLSNLPFMLVGIMGCLWILNPRSTGYLPQLKWAYGIFFAGVAVVALGSGYYHLDPSNGALVWDRLPMTVAFMALLAIIVGEFISPRAGRVLLLPLLIAGVASVLYWHVTEIRGAGDLRPYALVQFLPMLLIPAILLLFKPAYTRTRGYWQLMGCYALAKICEYFDAGMFNLLPVLSGHSLKHAVAAAGVYCLLKAYQTRVLITP